MVITMRRQDAITSRALARLGAGFGALVGAVDPIPSNPLVKAFDLAIGSGLSDRQAEFAVAVGQFESYLGVKDQWLLPSGEPSFNWGAVMSFSASEPSFKGPGGRMWLRFDTMKAGLDRFLAIGSVKRALSAIEEDGNVYAAVGKMFDGKYWECSKTREECVRAYGDGVFAVSKTVAKANGKPVLLSTSGEIPGAPVTSSAGWSVFLGVIGLAAGAYVYTSGRRREAQTASRISTGANVAQVAVDAAEVV